MSGETFDVVLGRRTYDQWSSYWPSAPKGPMADRLNAATKCVATHRPESLQWGPVEAVGTEFIESIRTLKSGDGADLIVSGSTSLTSSMIEH